MNTIRPATFTPNTETEACPAPVKDLTFILGPPTDRDASEQIAEAAAGVNVTPDELWVEMVRGNVAELIELTAEGRSILDEVVSDAVGETVTVWDVSGALHFQSGRRFPGLIIQTSQILGADGRPIERDFADYELRHRMAAALARYTHADWVTCTACRVIDELGFPSLDEAPEDQS